MGTFMIGVFLLASISADFMWLVIIGVVYFLGAGIKKVFKE